MIDDELLDAELRRHKRAHEVIRPCAFCDALVRVIAWDGGLPQLPLASEITHEADCPWFVPE